MSDHLRFSIVIPTYRRDHVLIRCLRALAPQVSSRSEAEIIIVNDGGKRDELDLMSAMFPNCSLKICHLPSNQGPAAARNEGVRQAQGTHILFLDDDSVPASDWFMKASETWEVNPQLDGFGGLTVCHRDDTFPCRVNSFFFNWFLTTSDRRRDGFFLSTCNASYKRSSLLKSGGFKEKFKTAAGEDRELQLRMSQSGGVFKLIENLRVGHEQGLDVRSFLRKHYLYGRAAFHIYNEYPTLKRFPLAAYLKLFRSVFMEFESFWGKVAACCLMLCSQAAAWVGYVSAKEGPQ